MEQSKKLASNDLLKRLLLQLETCMIHQMFRIGSSNLIFTASDYVVYQCRRNLIQHFKNGRETYIPKSFYKFHMVLPKMKQNIIIDIDEIVEKTQQFINAGEFQVWQIEHYVMENTL